MTHKLTVHILDMAIGESAKGVEVIVERFSENKFTEVARDFTAVSGRTDKPLLENENFFPARYILSAKLGDYFRRQSTPFAGEPSFVDVIRFEWEFRQQASYHIPLIVTPWSYSVYRGS